MSLKTRIAKLESAEPQYRTHTDIVHFHYYGIYPPGRENLPPQPHSDGDVQRIMRIKEKFNNRSPEEKERFREVQAKLRVKQKARRQELRNGKR